MAIAHAFLALVAGFACSVMVVLVTTALLRRGAPDWAAPAPSPRAGYVVVHLGASFLAGAAGGYVSAWAAGRSALATVLALAVVVLVLGAVSALQARGTQPVWYQLALVIIAPVGVVVGGLVRLRLLGVL